MHEGNTAARSSRSCHDQPVTARQKMSAMAGWQPGTPMAAGKCSLSLLRADRIRKTLTERRNHVAGAHSSGTKGLDCLRVAAGRHAGSMGLATMGRTAHRGGPVGRASAYAYGSGNRLRVQYRRKRAGRHADGAGGQHAGGRRAERARRRCPDPARIRRGRCGSGTGPRQCSPGRRHPCRSTAPVPASAATVCPGLHQPGRPGCRRQESPAGCGAGRHGSCRRDTGRGASGRVHRAGTG